MKRIINQLVFALALVSAGLGAIVGLAFAQQPAPPTLEQQQFQDALGVLQREAEGERGRARQAELAISKLQRDLVEAQKAAAACAPVKVDKK